MYRAQKFFTAFMPRARFAFVRQQELKANVRRTHGGVRIKFSDGRLSWLAKQPQVADDTFRTAVEQWIRRHGVGANEIRWE